MLHHRLSTVAGSVLMIFSLAFSIGHEEEGQLPPNNVKIIHHYASLQDLRMEIEACHSPELSLKFGLNDHNIRAIIDGLIEHYKIADNLKIRVVSADMSSAPMISGMLFADEAQKYGFQLRDEKSN